MMGEASFIKNINDPNGCGTSPSNPVRIYFL